MIRFFKSNLSYMLRMFLFTAAAFFAEISFAFWCFGLSYPPIHVVGALSLGVAFSFAMELTIIRHHIQGIRTIHEEMKKLRGVDR